VRPTSVSARKSISARCPIKRTDFRCADFVREQGAVQFKNGAYTLVREYFKLGCNAAIEQKMRI
jgi:hypothetical protein